MITKEVSCSSGGDVAKEPLGKDKRDALLVLLTITSWHEVTKAGATEWGMINITPDVNMARRNYPSVA